MTIEVDYCQGYLYLRNIDGTDVCISSAYTPLDVKKSCQTEGPVVKMPTTRIELVDLAKRVDQKNGARTVLGR